MFVLYNRFNYVNYCVSTVNRPISLFGNGFVLLSYNNFLWLKWKPIPG